MAESRRSKRPADEIVVANEFEAADALDNDFEETPACFAAMECALERLRGRHLAFRRAEKCEVCDLDELRLNILTATTDPATPADYYDEVWKEKPWSAGFSPSPIQLPNAYRRIAVMQLELMSRAFYVLRLDLFANAPENHGWMNLFRNWGRSGPFNQVFEELRHTLRPEFVKFYVAYLRNLRNRTGVWDHLPIHHPWLKPRDDKDLKGRGLYMDSGRTEADLEIEVRPGAGTGALDQRGSDAPDQPFEKPSGRPPESSGDLPNE